MPNKYFLSIIILAYQLTLIVLSLNNVFTNNELIKIMKTIMTKFKNTIII